MNLNTELWKDFKLADLFDVDAGKYYYSDEYSEGNTPYCSASAENNGVDKKIDVDPTFKGNQIITGKVGCTTFYQPKAFCATSDVNVLTPKFDMSCFVGLFITTVINKNENYRWNYGRQCRIGNTRRISIKLPIKRQKNNKPVIDKDNKYSSDGYIPDFAFMESYIKQLHYKPITTVRSNNKIPLLDVERWEEFVLSDLFKVKYGINMELNACEETSVDDQESVAFVARTAEKNGVSAYVKRMDDKIPQPAGTITVAGGGSVLSTFVQFKEFYSGRDLYLLLPKEEISIKSKMFVATVLYENRYRYSYGRQANTTLQSLVLKLPIQRDDRGNPIVDEENKYCKKGYIPDWKFMENYIDSLPYSDRI